jgi:hypothetical protein
MHEYGRAPLEALRHRVTIANRLRQQNMSEEKLAETRLFDQLGTPFRTDQVVDERSEQALRANIFLLRNYVFTHGEDYATHPDIIESLVHGNIEPGEISNKYWLHIPERDLFLYADKECLREDSEFFWFAEGSLSCSLSFTDTYSFLIQFSESTQESFSPCVTYSSYNLPVSAMTQEENDIISAHISEYVQALT